MFPVEWINHYKRIQMLGGCMTNENTQLSWLFRSLPVRRRIENFGSLQAFRMLLWRLCTLPINQKRISKASAKGAPQIPIR